MSEFVEAESRWSNVNDVSAPFDLVLESGHFDVKKWIVVFFLTRWKNEEAALITFTRNTQRDE